MQFFGRALLNKHISLPHLCLKALHARGKYRNAIHKIYKFIPCLTGSRLYKYVYFNDRWRGDRPTKHNLPSSHLLPFPPPFTFTARMMRIVTGTNRVRVKWKLLKDYCETSIGKCCSSSLVKPKCTTRVPKCTAQTICIEYNEQTLRSHENFTSAISKTSNAAHD